ncbi:TetR/AcrR family transcriptional regulator [Modestobacter roseus]|uniref:TetR family transcriptional regulator n=1 Tax=Modestobacter roseus TaxID=1181884 RepID=A0A562IM17_9ACTN|nr:TetR/AcrR family transcriptional regulator [Modestobacter roseus]MQA33760.1 TetR family transcriptional regulator [Modestobacter roseus]TWH72057.1 TetR family transcriptional regulator [Modestobacter roseus]
MPATAPRGPYAKTEGVRRRIVEACVEAFGETGFYGATMKDVARRAGISYTGLLHHFASKEELLTAVLALRAELSTEYLRSAQALDPRTQPLEALRGMLGVVAENEHLPGLLALHCVLAGEATSPDHPAHTHYAEQYRALRHFYAQAFTALAERGELAAGADPETLAVMTVALMNGLQAQWLFDREHVRMAASMRQFLLTYLPGLAR